MLVTCQSKHTKKKWIKNNMSSYKHHSIALNKKDQELFEAVHKQTGYGVTEIFRKMLYAIEKTLIPTETKHETTSIIVEE